MGYDRCASPRRGNGKEGAPHDCRRRSLCASLAADPVPHAARCGGADREVLTMFLSFLSLSELGWSDHWAGLLADLDHPRAEPGRVVRCDRGSVLVATGDKVLAASVAGRAEPVVTGDWVALDEDRILEVLARRGVLRRRGPDGREQLLAANVEVVLIVCGLDRPVKPGRVQRSAVQAWDAGAVPILVLAKADVSGASRSVMEELSPLLPALEAVATSVRTGEGLEELRNLLAGRTAALLGESGAGKSSLLNALIGEAVVATREVRRGDAKGRHTTTRRELHPVPGAGVIIDTPGLRSLGLASEPEAITVAFGDVEALAARCRFRDCRHAGEPGCAVSDAVSAGELSGERVTSYQRLQREVRSEILRADPYERRRQGRRFGRQAREAQRLKRREQEW